uniref:R3H-associated N-terminal domain-containing protein n=1 Tax=Kalanchoe fedtschenkoi TaxID=63787 RepID=A0A7N0T4C0_KALFE
MKAHAKTRAKVRGSKSDDKTAVLTAWHRVDCRTREALRRSFLSDFIEHYETCIRTFVMESHGDDHLVLHVQDPFHRLLLHGICEVNFCYVLTRVKKKKTTSAAIPNITLTRFLRLSKEGGW